jgi:NAD-dependent deacetylase
MPASPEENILHAAELICAAKHTVVFTGAGISTPSGIPDFRSAKTGLWLKDDPMQVASLTAFRSQPRVFFDWLRPLAKTAFHAQPNPAHIALAKLEEAGLVKVVITQNIDNLHQKSGIKNIIELHGSMNSLTCQKCRKSYPINNFVESFIESQELPLCPHCCSLLKPDIILFEEMLSMQAWSQAEDHCDKADLVLVVGSSLEVSPANTLPVFAVRHAAKLIINNFSPTFLDSEAELLFPCDVVEFMPLLVRKVLSEKIISHPGVQTDVLAS